MNRPLHLNTQVEEDRRYSFAETPLEMHASGHHPALASAQQVRADANPSPQPAIEQQMHPSPQPAIQQQAHPSPQPAIQQEMHPAQYAASEKVQQFQHQGFMPTYSNYPGPERHPAHDAPFADAPQQQSDIQMHQFQYKQPPNSPGPLPVKTHPGTEPYTSRRDTVTVTPDMNPLQSPKSPYLPPPVAAGTSQAPAVDDLSSYHQPGQVLHPNQEVIGGTWSHGLCECSNIGTCCLGITCPCVLYGKTQHRLSAKSRKEDPTNMLGYQWCNGSCTAMALLCGCQCMWKIR